MKIINVSQRQRIFIVAYYILKQWSLQHLSQYNG